MLSLMYLREVHIRLSPSVAVEACGSDVRCQTRPDLMDGVSRGDHCHLAPHSSLQQAYKNCTPSPVKPRGTSARSFSCCSKQLVWLQADQYLASLPLLAREMMQHEKLWHWLGPGGGAWVLVLREMVLLLTQLASSAVVIVKRWQGRAARIKRLTNAIIIAPLRF